jgi:hypothetical protein
LQRDKFRPNAVIERQHYATIQLFGEQSEKETEIPLDYGSLIRAMYFLAHKTHLRCQNEYTCYSLCHHDGYGSDFAHCTNAFDEKDNASNESACQGH